MRKIKNPIKLVFYGEDIVVRSSSYISGIFSKAEMWSGRRYWQNRATRIGNGGYKICLKRK